MRCVQAEPSSRAATDAASAAGEAITAGGDGPSRRTRAGRRRRLESLGERRDHRVPGSPRRAQAVEQDERGSGAGASEGKCRDSGCHGGIPRGRRCGRHEKDGAGLPDVTSLDLKVLTFAVAIIAADRKSATADDRTARSAMSQTVGRRRTFGAAALVIAAVVLAGCTTHSGSPPEAAGTAGNPPATSSSPSTSTGPAASTPTTAPRAPRGRRHQRLRRRRPSSASSGRG